MNRWKLTRKQLVALAPCEDGLRLFDELAPSGTIALLHPSKVEAHASRIGCEFAGWIGNVLPTKAAAREGSGYGYGYGDGSGSGYGSWTAAGARVVQGSDPCPA